MDKIDCRQKQSKMKPPYTFMPLPNYGEVFYHKTYNHHYVFVGANTSKTYYMLLGIALDGTRPTAAYSFTCPNKKYFNKYFERIQPSVLPYAVRIGAETIRQEGHSYEYYYQQMEEYYRNINFSDYAINSMKSPIQALKDLMQKESMERQKREYERTTSGQPPFEHTCPICFEALDNPDDVFDHPTNGIDRHRVHLSCLRVSCHRVEIPQCPICRVDITDRLMNYSGCGRRNFVRRPSI